jgi:hypothetical protein
MPDTVRIGPIDYAIAVTDNLHSAEGTKLCGQASYSTQTLRVDSKLPQPFRRIILWHEIVHVIFEQTGQAQDEGVIDAISYALPQILRDNPWLAEFPEAT